LSVIDQKVLKHKKRRGRLRNVLGKLLPGVPLEVVSFSAEVSFMRHGSLWLMLAVCVLLPAVAAAADASGKWKAEFSTPDGTARVNTFTFQVDGGNLTGTVAGAQDETPIKNGKITGDDIAFSAERPFGTFTYTGKIKENEIAFKVVFNDQTFEMIAKRTTN
jgi:hypothetical protein